MSCSPNAAGLSPLQLLLIAAKDGEGEMGPDDPNAGVLKSLTMKLLNAGALVNVRDAEGNTPLHVSGTMTGH